jgi:hypothetical protein
MEVLAALDIRLLDANWLLSCPDDHKIQRCQELPNEAFLTGDQAVELFWKFGGLVIVSYGWLSKAHPDPHAFHFRTLKHYLNVHSIYFKAAHGLSAVGVFWDYASLPQPDASGKRTPEEKAVFSRGLKAINTLYGSMHNTVVQLKRMPGKFDSFPHINKTLYDDRGWCYFEEVVASIQKYNLQLLNLALVETLLETSTNWFEVASAAQATRRPPLNPYDFADELSKRVFTNGTDFQIVVEIYSEFFSYVSPTVSQLTLQQTQQHSRTENTSHTAWTSRELRHLSNALPHFVKCERLDLHGQHLGDNGVEMLVPSLCKLKELKEVNLHRCGFGVAGIKKLQSWIKECSALEKVTLPLEAKTRETEALVKEALKRKITYESLNQRYNEKKDGKEEEIQEIDYFLRGDAATDRQKRVDDLKDRRVDLFKSIHTDHYIYVNIKWF